MIRAGQSRLESIGGAGGAQKRSAAARHGCQDSDASLPHAADAVLKILETFVDHAADASRASAALEQISSSGFRREPRRRTRFTDSSDALHGALRQLGRREDGISHVRDMLLGIDRIIAFVLDNDPEGHVAGHGARLPSAPTWSR